jgi:PAS domain S-box-containing protein
MNHQITPETLEEILKTLPLELTFIDENDVVRYHNVGRREIFSRPNEAIGKNVQDCHPQKSISKVNEVITELKSGKRDFAEYWINYKGHKIYIRYFPVKDKNSKYLGILEIIQDITEVKKITGQKRLIQDSWLTRLED